MSLVSDGKSQSQRILNWETLVKAALVHVAGEYHEPGKAEPALHPSEISLRGWEEAQGRIKMRLRISGSTRRSLYVYNVLSSRNQRTLGELSERLDGLCVPWLKGESSARCRKEAAPKLELPDGSQLTLENMSYTPARLYDMMSVCIITRYTYDMHICIDII